MSKLEIDFHDLSYRIKDFTVHCQYCDGTNTELIIQSREEENASCAIWCIDCEKDEQLIE